MSRAGKSAEQVLRKRQVQCFPNDLRSIISLGWISKNEWVPQGAPIALPKAAQPAPYPYYSAPSSFTLAFFGHEHGLPSLCS
jgi:hypothetical protein